MTVIKHSFKDWFFSTPYQRRQWSHEQELAYQNHDDVVTRFIEANRFSTVKTHDKLSIRVRQPDIALKNPLEAQAVKQLREHNYILTHSIEQGTYDLSRWHGVIFRVRTGQAERLAIIYRRDFERQGRLDKIAKVDFSIAFQTILPNALMLGRDDFKEK